MADKKKPNIWEIMQGVGMGMSGFAAPFLGDMGWQQRQQELLFKRQQQQAQQKFNEWMMTQGMGVSPQMGMTPEGEMGITGISLSPTSPRVQIGQTPEAQMRRQVEVQKQKDIAQMDVKRQILAKDLDSFMAVDDVLHRARGTGWGRFGAGAKMTWEGIGQNTLLGRSVSMHDDAAKRLRVQLVRAAGDVGNINIVEQKAAEQLIPRRFDDYGKAEIKRTYLRELMKAINSGDGNGVRNIIQQFMKAGDIYTPMDFKTEAEAEKANLPKGTTIIINGRRAIWE